MPSDFTPFTNDNQVLTIGEMTIENDPSAVDMHGELTITPDDDGYQKAVALLAFAENLMAAFDDSALMTAAKNHDDSPLPSEHIDNPFL